MCYPCHWYILFRVIFREKKYYKNKYFNFHRLTFHARTDIAFDIFQDNIEAIPGDMRTKTISITVPPTSFPIIANKAELRALADFIASP